MLAKPKLCLAMQQFGAFILVLHTGEIDSAETPKLRAIDLRRLLFSCCSIVLTTRESPISDVAEIYP